MCPELFTENLMNKNLAQEVIACLPRGKTRFDYFKDRYALLLLSYVVGKAANIGGLRRSRFGRLLGKPAVKRLLATSGDGLIYPEQINSAWEEPSLNFLLTLSTWKGRYQPWNQTSRPGDNLVLQLNFTSQHRRDYIRLVKPLSSSQYINWGHPVMRQKERTFYRDTLAWARIDFDYSTDEALIEEIQTDWLREARSHLERERRHVKRYNDSNPFCQFYEERLQNLEHYVNHTLRPYYAVWDEAMLAATIQFIRNELGIRKIFYHTFDTGRLIKRIPDTPPRSLYTALPRSFCFEEVDTAPRFLQRSLRRRLAKFRGELKWFQLDLSVPAIHGDSGTLDMPAQVCQDHAYSQSPPHTLCM